MGIENNDSIYFAKVGENRTYLESKTEALLSSAKMGMIMSVTLLVVGFAFFSMGYIKFVRQHHKKK